MLLKPQKTSKAKHDPTIKPRTRVTPPLGQAQVLVGYQVEYRFTGAASPGGLVMGQSGREEG